MRRLRLAIVGAGMQGTNHARVAKTLRDAVVTTVVDRDVSRAKTLAEAVDANFAMDVQSILGEVDAAIVAVPAESHCSVALELMRSGAAVLVEKPLAATLEDASALLACSVESGVTLMTGHVERFNPAIIGLEKLLVDPFHFDAIRASSYSNRIEVDVILDMMIHDLDLVLALARSEVSSVQAVTRSIRSVEPDLACAIVAFENGTTANLVANRVGQRKIRTLNVTQSQNFLVADLLRQDLSVNRVDHAEYLSSTGMAFRETGMVEIPFLEQRGEPLLLELEHFVNCVLTATPPKVSGFDGLRALELALRVADVGRKEK